MGTIKKEGDIVVASDSKPKLWKDMSLKRAVQHCNMEDVKRCEESRISVESVHQQ